MIISNNQIYQCDTAGIYIQGRASRPKILNNKIAFCKGLGVITNLDVEALIKGNEILLNKLGIEIVNNKSKVVGNFITKQHEEGIRVIGDNKSTRSTPEIWCNFV